MIIFLSDWQFYPQLIPWNLCLNTSKPSTRTLWTNTEMTLTQVSKNTLDFMQQNWWHSGHILEERVIEISKVFSTKMMTCLEVIPNWWAPDMFWAIFKMSPELVPNILFYTQAKETLVLLFLLWSPLHSHINNFS